MWIPALVHNRFGLCGVQANATCVSSALMTMMNNSTTWDSSMIQRHSMKVACARRLRRGGPRAGNVAIAHSRPESHFRHALRVKRVHTTRNRLADFASVWSLGSSKHKGFCLIRRPLEFGPVLQGVRGSNPLGSTKIPVQTAIPKPQSEDLGWPFDIYSTLHRTLRAISEPLGCSGERGRTYGA